MTKALLPFFIAFLLPVFIYAQESFNNLGLTIAVGLSGRTLYSNPVIENWKPKDGLFTSYGLEYGREIGKFEIILNLTKSHFNDVLKVSIDSFKVTDSSYYVGFESVNNTHYWFLTFTPACKYNLIESGGFTIFTKTSFGFNHLFKDMKTIKNDFQAIYTNSDTTIYNSLKNDSFKLLMSGSLAFGFVKDICNNFSITSELYYQSFLHNIYKESVYHTWTRLYSYGCIVGLKYHF